MVLTVGHWNVVTWAIICSNSQQENIPVAPRVIQIFNIHPHLKNRLCSTHYVNYEHIGKYIGLSTCLIQQCLYVSKVTGIFIYLWHSDYCPNTIPYIFIIFITYILIYIHCHKECTLLLLKLLQRKKTHNSNNLLSNPCNTCCGEFLPSKSFEVKASTVALFLGKYPPLPTRGHSANPPVLSQKYNTFVQSLFS